MMTKEQQVEAVRQIMERLELDIGAGECVISSCSITCHERVVTPDGATGVICGPGPLYAVGFTIYTTDTAFDAWVAEKLRGVDQQRRSEVISSNNAER